MKKNRTTFLKEKAIPTKTRGQYSLYKPFCAEANAPDVVGPHGIGAPAWCFCLKIWHSFLLQTEKICRDRGKGHLRGAYGEGSITRALGTLRSWIRSLPSSPGWQQVHPTPSSEYGWGWDFHRSGPWEQCLLQADLYTTHAKTINSIAAKCENGSIQSPQSV